MNKETSSWLRKAGFGEDRSYYHVWQYRSKSILLTTERSASFCFELSQESDTQYKMCVTLECEGTSPTNYSQGSVWLFSDTGTSPQELFKKSLEKVDIGFFYLKDSVQSVKKQIESI